MLSLTSKLYFPDKDFVKEKYIYTIVYCFTVLQQRYWTLFILQRLKIINLIWLVWILVCLKEMGFTSVPHDQYP